MSSGMSDPRFRLAPMSRAIAILTIGLLALPLGLVAGAMIGVRPLLIPAALLLAAYAWTWLLFRPTAFVVHQGVLEVEWPLKRRQIPRHGISDVRLLDRHGLRREIGWGLRVGVGGLWGAFGWLWTSRRGIVQMYVSRIDRFVWIERPGDRPWLITPEQPEMFVRTLGRPA